MSDFFLDVSEGKVRAVKSWLENGSEVNCLDKNGNSALHLATEKGFRGVCKVLLDAGARVNMKSLNDGRTAVHYAAIEGHKDILRMLLAHGANLNIKDKDGNTAEEYADRFHNFEVLNVIEEFLVTKSESTSTLSQSESERTLTEESDDDESSMMNWVIYGNMTKQPDRAKRSRSALQKVEERPKYDEISTNLDSRRKKKSETPKQESPKSRQPDAESSERRKVLDSWTMSSQTIPDDLLSLDLDRDGETESEKVVLLKRLQSLVGDENEEKVKLLKMKKESLKIKEDCLEGNIGLKKEEHLKMLDSLSLQFRKETEELTREQQKEEDRIQEKIDKLELDLRSLVSSSLLVSSLLSPNPPGLIKQDKAGYFPVLDLEDEISCCSCQELLTPPHKIYQVVRL